MSKIEEAKEDMYKTAKEVSPFIDRSLTDQVCDYLGPVMFRKDAALVAYSSKDELKSIRENFIKKRLQITDSDELIDDAIQSVGEKYGMSVRNKKRAVVYALLMEYYGIDKLPEKK